MIHFLLEPRLGLRQRHAFMTEVAHDADFSKIRYAQCWEDADVLLQGLAPGPGKCFLSIASAGENSFSLLAAGAKRVVAVDMNPAQLACVELRRAAYAVLEHWELLQLIGSRPCDDRNALLERCLPKLPESVAQFWTSQPELVRGGIGACGKFEHYFRKFREKALPLVHSKKTIHSLLESREPAARVRFYDENWNTWRWRLLFKFFFSRFVMGRLGRDPRFFKYVEGSVADRIMNRTRHALTHLEPANNPYLHWILTGKHGAALPHALREENFLKIRRNLDRLEVFHGSIENYLEADPLAKFDGFNLSDIFEYMSEEATAALYARLLDAANPGSRLAYWNMLAPRRCPAGLESKIQRHTSLGLDLLASDKAFFYSAFLVEEAR